MPSNDKSKKSRTKPPRGRPAATSALSQPVVQDASHLTALSSFSPNGNLFAFLSLSVDKHRLRVYDTVNGQSVAEHIIDSARVTALTCTNFDPSEAHRPSAEDESLPPNKKKRKKRNSQAAETNAQNKGIEVVVLGLSDGTLLFFSPTHGRVLRTLSHTSSTSSILSIVTTENEDSTPIIWTSGDDGTIRLWNAQKNEILGSWKNDDRIPYSSMAVRPGSYADQEGRVDVLVANHSIRLLSTNGSLTEGTNFDSQKPKQLASFTGHASAITHLQWDASQTPSTRFLTMAEADRFVYVWEVPETQSGSSAEGKIIASIPLDSDARTIALSVPTSSTPSSTQQSLLTLAASGKISVFPIPTELVAPASSNRVQHKVPTLLPRSNVSAASKKNASAAPIVDATFAHGEQGRLRVARLVGGARPVFDVVVSIISKLNGLR